MRPNADTDFPLNPSLPHGEHVAIHAAIRGRPATPRPTRLRWSAWRATIEAIIARQESVDSDDLATLGWTLTQIAEIAPSAGDGPQPRAASPQLISRASGVPSAGTCLAGARIRPLCAPRLFLPRRRPPVPSEPPTPSVAANPGNLP